MELEDLLQEEEHISILHQEVGPYFDPPPLALLQKFVMPIPLSLMHTGLENQAVPLYKIQSQ